MICPNCNVECIDSICPKCNGYFDEELLAMSQNASSGDDSDDVSEAASAPAVDHHHKKKVRRNVHEEAGEGERPKKRRRPAPGNSRNSSDDEAAAVSNRNTSGSSGSTNSSGSGGTQKYKGKYDQYWEEDEPWQKAKPVTMKDADGNEVVYGQSQYGAPTEGDGNLSGLPFDPLLMCKDGLNGFLALPFMEKVYTASSLVTVIFALYPWYTYMSTAEETLGLSESAHLMSQFPVVLVAILPLIGILIKTHPNTLSGFPRKIIPLLPVGAGLIAAVVTLLSMIYIWHGKNMSMDKVSVGGTFIAACLTFLGGGGSSLFGKKSQNS